MGAKQKASQSATISPVVPAAALPAWIWRRDGAITGAVFVVAAAAFANTLRHNFVYDDLTIIRDNPRLVSPWNLRAFFGTSYWGEAQPGTQLYRPLTLMSFAIDRALFGPGPAGVHLMNVLANAIVAALIYVLLFRLLGRRDVAMIAALLFALHPVHTEAVANGVGRGELYAAIAMLTAMLLHLEYARRGGAARPQNRSRPKRGEPTAGGARGTGISPQASRRGDLPVRTWAGRPCHNSRRGLLAGAMAMYFVSLLFKESAAVLPAILWVMEWMIVEQGRLRPLLARPGRFLLYGLPLLVYAGMRIGVVGVAAPAIPEVMYGATTTQRWLHANETMFRYIGQLVWPLTLSADYADYSRRIAPKLSDPLAMAALLAWPAWAALFYGLYKRRRHALIFAAAWFLLTMLPVSNLIVSIGTVRADRLLFIPSLGFALALALGIAWLARTHRAAAYALLLVVLGLYSWRTVTRNRDWYSHATLLAATVRQNPGSPLVWAFIGDLYRAEGQFAKAEAAYQRSFELRDAAGFFYSESHIKYAEMCLKRGDKAAAEQHLRLVLSVDPRHYFALLNLGELLLHEDASRAESIELLKRALAEQPESIPGYAGLATAYKLGGQMEAALETVEGAIRSRRNEARLWSVKAEILSAMQRWEEAQEAERRAAGLRAP